MDQIFHLLLFLSLLLNSVFSQTLRERLQSYEMFEGNFGLMDEFLVSNDQMNYLTYDDCMAMNNELAKNFPELI